MTEQLQPLAEGEHVDLDTGMTVERVEGAWFSLDGGDYGQIDVTDEEIRQIAELAGYEVSERE